MRVEIIDGLNVYETENSEEFELAELLLVDCLKIEEEFVELKGYGVEEFFEFREEKNGGMGQFIIRLHHCLVLI